MAREGAIVTTDRSFCRFSRLGDVPFGMPEVPDGGLCLSAFLVLSERGCHDHILMGHLDPAAPWDHIGALDPSRTAVHSKGWMLPSSHLIVHESPYEAAQRVAAEQLGRRDLQFSPPRVVSDVYTPKRFPNIVRHWDLEFIFCGEWPDNAVSRTKAWTDLRFVDLARTSRTAMARSHEDIIESVGLRFGSV